MHAKIIVVDGKKAFVGSENISAQSLDQNRELGIIVSDANVLSRLQTTFQKDWAISQSVLRHQQHLKAIFVGTLMVKKRGRCPPCISTLFAVSPTFSPPVDILTFDGYSTANSPGLQTKQIRIEM